MSEFLERTCSDFPISAKMRRALASYIGCKLKLNVVANAWNATEAIKKCSQMRFSFGLLQLRREGPFG